MKIILIHHRYYHASGPERYLFNVKRLLEQNGHEVIPFSINYPENEESDYQKYFIDPVIKNSSFHINKIKNISVLEKVKIVRNSFFNKDAYNNFTKLVNDVKPDLVYILQFIGKISTSVLDVAKNNKIPIVLRLSDYNLVCGKNILYKDGEICEKCLHNSMNVVFQKCIQNSYPKSVFFYLAKQYNNLKNFQKKVHTIIVPSKFTKEKIKESSRYKDANIVHIPTFIWNDEIKNFKSKKVSEIKFCYIGRIADDKGIEVLLKAFKELKIKGIEPQLTIFGDNSNSYGDYLKDISKSLRLNNIEFFGFLLKSELFEKLEDYHFSIIPSVWYDNMPNSFIESQAAGLPVIASEIGSLKEMTTDGRNGFLFKSEDSGELSNCIQKVLGLNEKDINEMSLNSINWAHNYCSEENHYESLISVFEKAICENEKVN